MENIEKNNVEKFDIVKSIKNVIREEELVKREKELLAIEKRIKEREEQYERKVKERDEQHERKVKERDEQHERKVKERDEQHERKVREYDPKVVEVWKRTHESSLSKPLNVDEVANWGMQILGSVPFVSLDDTEELWMYKGGNYGYYAPFGEIYLKKLCAKCGDNRACDPGVLRKLTMKIKGESYLSRKKFVHPEGFINLKDGVFDLNEEKVLEHDHKYYFKGVLNVSYDKGVECPVWENSIKNMVFDEENCLKFQKWIGYHFIEKNIEQKALGLCGPSGSGKSKVLMVLRELLGKENVTNFELQDLNNPSTYSLGRLYGKLANINFDMSQMPIREITMMKKIISGDPVNARNIRESPFELECNAKFTFACNKTPYVSDRILSTREFQRRFMLIETRVGYETDDKNIYNKYLTELCSGGIFNWVVEGYKLYKQEGFKEEDIYTVWKENMDTTHAPKEENKENAPKEKDKENKKFENGRGVVIDPDELEKIF